MWLYFSGYGIWIILGIIYGVAVFVCYLREEADNRRRAAEQEERRRIQNAEWEEQLRQNPGLRLILILGEQARRQRVEDRETLRALREWKKGKDKEKPNTNWKEEGF